MPEIIKNINAKLFRAVYMTVSKEPTRYYLNGVYVEPHPHGGVLLVSTDGHRMTVAHDPDATATRPAILNLSVSPASIVSKRGAETTNTISAFTSSKNGMAEVYVMKYGMIVTDAAGNDAAGWEIDGDFPSFRKVIPEIEKGPCYVGFNGKYLKKVHDAAKLLSGEKSTKLSVRVTKPEAPILVRCDHPDASNIFWIVMPMRTAPAALPEFYTSTLPKKKAPAKKSAAKKTGGRKPREKASA